MKRYLGAVFVLFCALTIAVACSEQGGSQEQAAVKREAQSQADSKPQAAAMPAGQQPAAEMSSEQAAASDEEEIQGTVVKTDEGIVIFSDRGSYMVAGQDLEGLVGKNVKITGTVEEAEGRSVVTVSSVAVIE